MRRTTFWVVCGCAAIVIVGAAVPMYNSYRERNDIAFNDPYNTMRGNTATTRDIADITPNQAGRNAEAALDKTAPNNRQNSNYVADNYGIAQQGTQYYYQYGITGTLPSNFYNYVTPNKSTTSTKGTTGTTGTTSTTTKQTAATNTSYEKQVLSLVNAERAKLKLPALTLNTSLSNVARTKAAEMRDKNYFSHTSPTYGSPSQMMTKFGIKWSASGENIAKGQKTPSAVMSAWMGSSGHKANILNKSYTQIGIGYVTASNGTAYWVQMFIKP